MSKPLSTEQLFRKCFGPSPLQVLDYNEIEHRLIALAARKFVKMENKQAMERALKVCDQIDKEDAIVLPKHFGEMRFKTACRKTTRKGT